MTTDSLTAPTSTTPTPETIWYLAYGSNMEPKVFSGRRKIQPLESHVVTVPNYWLSFDIGGIPFVEPCFASILKMDHSRMHQKEYALEVHSRTMHGREFVWDESHPEKSYPPVLQGVAHKITLRDWQLVIQSEGGWGHDVPTGYNQIQVDCVRHDSKEKLRAFVLESRPVSVKSHCQPSARYKNLLTSGAAHHKLDPSYQNYLANIVPYECTGVRSKIARVLFTLINSPMILMFAVIVLRNRGKPVEQHTRPPYWAAWVFDKAGRLSATIHDYMVAPIFGSGRCSSPQQQVITRMRIQESLKVPLSEEEHQKCREAEADKEPEVLKAAEKVVESVAE
ncbi:hypothetical protein BG015_005234 [Linnemannia schmuckeri]|uniref:gamma-glutamylcyclotransferase n=1 Tax=Linnemannia schmuckeri TaxID=64567 RepID=A0A9P5R8Q3_9FUNG|nr:hypothetical protein BG015_005234 [Linnemannia schmuckeri]